MEMNLNVTLPVFEGPLDLLLHLLEKNEVDIYDIPIALITTQFLAYMKSLETNALDVTSEFVVMASHLLEIKSKMLLPIHDDGGEETLASEEDPRYDLVQRLIEYKQYKDVAGLLQSNYDQHGGIGFKHKNELKRFATTAIDIEDDAFKVDVNALVKALNQVIERLPELDLTRRDYFKKLHRDQYTVEEKMTLLYDKFNRQSLWAFADLISDAKTKLELVVTFLALLEILKTGTISVDQDQTFETIHIKVIANGETNADTVN